MEYSWIMIKLLGIRGVGVVVMLASAVFILFKGTEQLRCGVGV